MSNSEENLPVAGSAVEAGASASLDAAQPAAGARPSKPAGVAPAPVASSGKSGRRSAVATPPLPVATPALTAATEHASPPTAPSPTPGKKTTPATSPPSPLLTMLHNVPLPPRASGDGQIDIQPTAEELEALEALFKKLPAAFTPRHHELLLQTFALASYAHRSQKRNTGEAYITHPLAVAAILANLHLDPETVAAALLHDVAEDTEFTVEYLQKHFGPSIAGLVDGVTRLKRINQISNMRQSAVNEKAESLRKMFLAMVEDIRVVLIKLADRLHNMHTLAGQPEHKQRRIARETLEIFAPLANRLGIWQIKWELEDLSFRYLEPETYRELSRAMQQKRAEREKWVAHVEELLEKELRNADIPGEVNGRPKHIYSIYRKMQRKGVEFDQIYDIHGFRIVVETVSQCYAALGIVHSHWRPIPGEFDDYIANPKDNLYRSLHTAVVGPNGKPMEVQIRTAEMHELAEYGIAAHWRYKEQAKADVHFDQKIAGLRQLMEWRQDVIDADEFVKGMKTDVFKDRAYVFTPQGDVIDLPYNATPIDFAYHVHTELGHRCRGARVNGKLVPLDHQLSNGDQVEIIAAKQGGPSRDWLNPNLGYVATQRARGKIRSWFRKQAREENIQQGRQVLDKELRRLSVSFTYEAVARLFGFEKPDDFLAAIGYGDINNQQIAQRVLDAEQRQKAEEAGPELPEKPPATRRDAPITAVYIGGLDGMLVHPARCCNPVPGDAIVGYITQGRGVSVHKTNCPNILDKLNRNDPKLVEAQWAIQAEETYPVSIQVRAYDRAGLLRDVTSLVADEKINMRGVEAITGLKNNMALINATLEISDVAQLTRVLTRIERLPNIVEVKRKVG